MNRTIIYKPKKNKSKKGRLWLITAINYMKEKDYMDFFKNKDKNEKGTLFSYTEAYDNNLFNSSWM
jgi:hypothetical protein